MTIMFVPPSILSNMMRVYDEELCHLPEAGYLSTRVKKFWHSMLAGTSLEIYYAGTEIGMAALCCRLDQYDTIHVGEALQPRPLALLLKPPVTLHRKASPRCIDQAV